MEINIDKDTAKQRDAYAITTLCHKNVGLQDCYFIKNDHVVSQYSRTLDNLTDCLQGGCLLKHRLIV